MQRGDKVLLVSYWLKPKNRNTKNAINNIARHKTILTIFTYFFNYS